MAALTITGTSANGIQVPAPDPISGGSGSLVLYDGWIDVDFASTGSAWVDAIAEFDRGPVWDELNLEFVNAIPKPAGGTQLAPDERLFEPKDRGTVISRVWSQLRSLSSGYREGGFFIVISRRR